MVARDQPVAVVEAMKMEMTVAADRAGVLHQQVAAGDALEAGDLMAMIARAHD